MPILTISNAEYHGMTKYEGSSKVRNAYKSIKEYLKPHGEPTTDQKFGTMFHSFFLEPANYEREYYFIEMSERPNPDSTMTEGKNKQWLANHKIIAGSRELVKSDNLERMEGMRESLLSYTKGGRFPVREIMACSTFEQSYLIDEFNGVSAKCRPDIDNALGLWDLKTCKSASEQACIKAIENFRYDIQAAWYIDVYEAVTGIRKPFYFMFVEKTEPFDCFIMELNEDWIEVGRRDYFKALERIIDYNKTKHIKGYMDYIDDIFAKPETPYWVLKKAGMLGEVTLPELVSEVLSGEEDDDIEY